MHILMSTIYRTHGHETPRFGAMIASLWAAIERRLVAFFETLAAWQDRAAQRHHLSQLDERVLRDVGLRRANVRRELEKPFWRT